MRASILRAPLLALAKAKRRSGTLAVMALAVMAFAPPVSGGVSWGPATPNFNLEAILRPVADGSDNGFGVVKFRQPKDADVIVYLDVWVRDLAPNTNYQLQRAVDTAVDDNCTSTAWLTLGQVTTDETGTGQAALSRNLAGAGVGAQFDIHFRVIDAQTLAVVLESACYQFTVSQ